MSKCTHATFVVTFLNCKLYLSHFFMPNRACQNLACQVYVPKCRPPSLTTDLTAVRRLNQYDDTELFDLVPPYASFMQHYKAHE